MLRAHSLTGPCVVGAAVVLVVVVASSVVEAAVVARCFLFFFFFLPPELFAWERAISCARTSALGAANIDA